MYVELHTSSAFSFLEGASLPETLVDRAAELGYSAIALIDRDGLYGAPRFHKSACAAGLRPIVGCELTMTRDRGSGAGGQGSLTGSQGLGGSGRSSLIPDPRSLIPGQSLWRLPVLVESQAGYRNLCRLITQMKLRAPKGEGALTLDDLDGFTGGLVALAGRPVLMGSRYGVGGLLDRLVGLFGRSNVYVELQRHLLRDEEHDNQALVALASAFHVPAVATNGVRFAASEDRPLYDVLTCIRHKTTLDRAGRRLERNAERYLKRPDQMGRLFQDMPDAVATTRDLADRLAYTMADLGYRFPDYPVPAGETESSFLRKIVEVGARARYRPVHDRARGQIARELDLIEKLDLSGYFLIVWDIVNFCRQHDILVQGRGSAANSAVCYSLGITAVDPVGMDLLFERFLSEERGEWPDIDLDLPSGDRRERVIQYVYERYGQLGAGMTANVITYRGRSAAREVGKTLAVAPEQIDRLAKVMNNFEWVDPADTLARHLAEAGFDAEETSIRLFADLWRRIQDLPRHLGQHSGGMVICQGRLDEVVPLENATMPGRVVVQWDKDDCADMGIVKVDLLGLGMMAVLQDALTMINAEDRGLGAPAAAAPGAPGAAAALGWEPGSPARPPQRGGTSESASRGAAASGGGAPRALNNAAVLQDTLTMVNTGARGSAPGARENQTENQEGIVSDQDASARKSGAHHERGTWNGERGTESGLGHSSLAPIDLAHLPPDDPTVYRMLQEADTIGVFQVESRAQMATLPRLRPARFYDIVVEVAIIRPGPIVGQMVHPYLKRRAGREPVVYPHPSLEPILARTLGVPLFQEQLLRMAMVAAGFSGGEAEELRRAFGFKRSVQRMKQIEVKLRAGMEKHGITGTAADQIVQAITSFALYGFPESHAASFALLVYASAYLKAHFPAAFYTAMLNNQPMGFYHPATLVKDAQRRGVRFKEIDVERSDWLCTVEPDGAIRLGLKYVTGLREEVGRAIEGARGSALGARKRPRTSNREPEPGTGSIRDHSSLAPGAERLAPSCPKCGCDDPSMLERVDAAGRWFCNTCAHEWEKRGPGASSGARRSALGAREKPRTSNQEPEPGIGGVRSQSSLAPSAQRLAPSHIRFASLEDLIARTGIRRDELVTLADIGALNSFGFDRRTALWQVERVIRPAGELFQETGDRREETGESPQSSVHSPQALTDGFGLWAVGCGPDQDASASHSRDPRERGTKKLEPEPGTGSPLRPMTPVERVVADYQGTSLTIGPHPMAFRRSELAMRGVLRAIDLARARNGRRVRVAGAVITRQRPGTAKGFVFLTLEDETGIANIIIRPDLFSADRLMIVDEPFLLVEGVLQIQDGVTSVKADHVQPLWRGGPDVESHDFY